MATPSQHSDDTEPMSDLVRLTFLVPRSWRDALKSAAGSQGVSMADLCRMILRAWLRNRYAADTAPAIEQPAA